MYSGQLSKWHLTDSCKRAFERAEAKKRDSLEKMKKAFAERKKRLQREANEWEAK